MLKMTDFKKVHSSKAQKQKEETGNRTRRKPPSPPPKCRWVPSGEYLLYPGNCAEVSEVPMH